MATRSGPLIDARLSPLAFLVGDEEDNVIVGTPGNDTIRGLDGDDVLRGLPGRDELYGGADNDTLFGNAGADLLLGRLGDDRLVGGRGPDVMEGEPGDDRLSGNQGADFLRGGAGNDVLQGNRGVDTLLGRSGDDVLDGGAGADVLEGGPNTDVFLFTNLDGRMDRITDLEDKDLLDLSALVPIETTDVDLADHVRQSDLPDGKLIEVRPEGAAGFTPLVLIEGTGVADLDAARLGLDDIPGGPTTTAVLSGMSSDSAASRIQEPGDTDWFRIFVQPGRDYTFDLGAPVADDGGTRLRALSDPVLELRNTLGPVASDDDGGPGRDARIVVESGSVVPGFYFLAASGAEGIMGDYVLTSTVETGPSLLSSGGEAAAAGPPAGGRALALDEVLGGGAEVVDQASMPAATAAVDPGPALPSVGVEDPSATAGLG